MVAEPTAAPSADPGPRPLAEYKKRIIERLIRPPNATHPGFLFRDATEVPYVIDTGDAFLFPNPDGTYPPATYRRCIVLGSTDWDDYLNRTWWDLTGGTPITTASHREITAAVAAQARNTGRPHHTVYRRVGEDAAGNIVIDIGGETDMVIVVTPKGWSVIDYRGTDVWFQRSPVPLPIPVPGGSIGLLRKHLNIKGDDDFNLAVAFLLASLRPRGTYPNATITGESGSTKTTLARRLCGLVDPTPKDVRAWVDSIQEIAINCINQWVVAYDNLSTVRAATSNLLCQMSTGGTHSSRTLYTNTGETTISLKHPLILTSVADVVTKPDLMDRALLIEMSPPTEDDRLDEDELAVLWEAEAPLILGALLNVLSGALAEYPKVGKVKKVRLPRMADFAKWMVAASPALGWEPGYFLRIYAENRSKGTAVALDANPWTAWVAGFVDDHFRVNPSATAYRIEPNALATLLNDRGALSASGRHFDGRSLTNALKELAPSLRKETGINWATARSNGIRWYEFTRVPKDESPPPAAPATLATVAPSGTSSTSLNEELESIFENVHEDA